MAYSWSPSWTLFRVCWRSAAALASDFILVEADDKCSFSVGNIKIFDLLCHYFIGTLASSHTSSISVSHPYSGRKRPRGFGKTPFKSTDPLRGSFSIYSRAIFSNLYILDQEIMVWFFSKIPQWLPVFRYLSHKELMFRKYSAGWKWGLKSNSNHSWPRSLCSSDVFL